MSEIRRTALMARFIDWHDGRTVIDQFEEFCLDVLVDLGPVYDKNQDAIHSYVIKHEPIPGYLSSREDALNKISHMLREVLKISTVVSYPKIKKPRKVKYDKARSGGVSEQVA